MYYEMSIEQGYLTDPVNTEVVLHDGAHAGVESERVITEFQQDAISEDRSGGVEERLTVCKMRTSNFQC